MSSSDGDGAGARPSGCFFLFGIVLTLGLSACTVQPLYAPTAATGGTVENVLGKIAIDAPPDRPTQEVRNRLIFTLGGGGGQPADPIYHLHLAVASADIPLGITDVDSASSYSVVVTATYDLTLVKTGALLVHATSSNQATYDRANQIYANVRAHVDAENRAAILVADDIRTRLAIAAANNFPGAAPGAVAANTATPPAATPATTK